jgi:hypothetical protein
MLTCQLPDKQKPQAILAKSLWVKLLEFDEESGELQPLDMFTTE